MPRRLKATKSGEARWVCGQWRGLVWAGYYTPSTRVVRVRFHRKRDGVFQRVALIAEAREVMAKRLDAEKAQALPAPTIVEYGGLSKHVPLLLAWLCDACYEDSSRRGKCRMQVERIGHELQVILKDADSGLCLVVREANATEAFVAVELLLGSEECPWVVDPYPMGQKSRRRKK